MENGHVPLGSIITQGPTGINVMDRSNEPETLIDARGRSHPNHRDPNLQEPLLFTCPNQMEGLVSSPFSDDSTEGCVRPPGAVTGTHFRFSVPPPCIFNFHVSWFPGILERASRDHGMAAGRPLFVVLIKCRICERH